MDGILGESGVEKSQLKIKILGTVFSIQSTERREYLEEIIQYYKQKVDEINEKAPATDPLKAAILAGLNVVDELFKEKNSRLLPPAESEVSALELNKITERMINKINTSLNNEQ